MRGGWLKLARGFQVPLKGRRFDAAERMATEAEIMPWGCEVLTRHVEIFR
jgi:hypothetical protein